VDELMVGVDGSEESRAALRWAADVADAVGARLRVVSAWQYPPVVIGRLELAAADETDAELERQLRALLAEVGVDVAEREVVIEALRGAPAEALLRAASEDVRMLVVGSRGLGGFRGLRLGSVSRQLCEHAPRPVTVVRRGVEASPVLRSILVGADGSDDAARAMGFAGRLATDVGADLVVVNATGSRDGQRPPSDEGTVDLETRRAWVEEWCAPLRDADVPYRIEVVRGDPRSALLDVTRETSADLVVVGSRGRGPIRQLVLGSVAASLVERCEVPVTVLPGGGAAAPDS
jgi:nucleotide-binding universal stress UspA family protein